MGIVFQTLFLNTYVFIYACSVTIIIIFLFLLNKRYAHASSKPFLKKFPFDSDIYLFYNILCVGQNQIIDKSCTDFETVI